MCEAQCVTTLLPLGDCHKYYDHFLSDIILCYTALMDIMNLQGDQNVTDSGFKMVYEYL